MARFYSRQKCSPYFVLNIKFDMLIFDVYYTFTALQIINYNYRINLIKVKAWEEVASQISECFPSRPPRTTQQCKKEHYSLVSRSRMEIGQKKRSICMTGKIVFINNSFIYVSYVIIYEKIISISIFSYILHVYLVLSLAYLTWIDNFLFFFFLLTNIFWQVEEMIPLVEEKDKGVRFNVHCNQRGHISPVLYWGTFEVQTYEHS